MGPQGGDTVQQYDYSKLLGRMRECGYTQEKLAKCLGISECSLNLSLNNKRNFRQDEMLKVGELLGVPASKLQCYFFAHKL
nr:DUF739 family protein [Intestinimonas massiliensis (ex Afouda et al. 2020)]